MLRTHITVLSTLAILLVAALFSLSVGRYPLNPADMIQAFSDGHSRSAQILWQLRLPRLLAALAIGSALATAGAAYQVMFRNPLVSPDILGVSAGAGFGAALAIYAGMNLVMIALSAFISGLVAVATVCLIAGRLKKSDNTLALVLTGVVVGSIFSALISLFKILADPYTQLSTITFWLMGGLNTITYTELAYTLPLLLCGLLPLVLLRWRVDLLTLGDEEAQSLGVNVAALRLLLIVSATLMTSAAVAVSGMIGWVGLIVPHIARLLVGAKFSRVLALSLLLGPLFLILADTAARTLAPIDLPLSILTAFIGAPYFVWLLLARERSS